ncbi:uncharacterized protein LOC129290775 isoform X2 [Prosopis cineraria]|uniref:uncharacterized protein LOC129290775 isoform X2 n=1 Tax=Prosopis cineraria TaxID=364024 RepID=UPI00240ED44C|nr:uncharacterized protein LOC129290775 isoform X2 [Prosopis cineraria]
MADCVASPLCVKLHMLRRPIRKRDFSFQTANFETIHRKNSRNGCKLGQFSSWRMFKLGADGSKDLNISPHLQATSLMSIGLGTLVDFDGATASDLVPVVDRVLLMASIFLTYMAGVIPVEKSYASGQKIISDKNMVAETSDNSGSAVKNNYQLNSNYVLNVVREKLLNALNTLEYKVYSGDCTTQCVKRPLSLNAVAEGPKLRLLWAAFEQIEEEVNNISSNVKLVIVDDWLRVFSEVVQRSYCSICMAWLEKEFSLGKSTAEKKFASLVLEKVKGDSIIVQSIKKSGKIDLYAELMCYLTCGSFREDCCFDPSLFALHGISILEDLVITLADEVASLYLEFISVDSDMSSETNRLDLSLCVFSTRELQKLRNEVALNHWLYHNMDTVVSMFEDRFDLCTLESRPIDLPCNSQTENQGWWKRLTQRKSNTVSSKLHYIVISSFSMAVKRTKELRALTGWRYYFSLFLEFSDIAMPLIRAIIDKVSEAISFFLVCLIGRSLGLIYTGIRQSLTWK